MSEGRAGKAKSGGTGAKNIMSLSTQEREVLERLVTGNTQRFIAETLALDDRIVSSMCREIMKKMDADDLAHLIRLGLEAGISLSRSE